MKRYFFFVFIKQQNRNSFRPTIWSARHPGFLIVNIGWGESGKAILQVKQWFRGLAWQFLGTVDIFSGQRRLRRSVHLVKKCPVRVWFLLTRREEKQLKSEKSVIYQSGAKCWITIYRANESTNQWWANHKSNHKSISPQCQCFENVQFT